MPHARAQIGWANGGRLKKATIRSEKKIKRKDQVRAGALPVERALEKLGIPRRLSNAGTILYHTGGPEALGDRSPGRIASGTGSPTLP